MEYRIFRGSAVNNLRTYMSASMGKEIVTSPDMFCLCAMEKGVVRGVGVFEAGTIARIYEINVLDRFKNTGIEQEILLAVCETLEEAGSKGVTMKIHESDGFAFWEPILERNEFMKGRSSALYHFLLVDAFASPLIKKARCPKGIIPLEKAAQWQRTDYDQRLRARRQFAFFNDKNISETMSAIYLQDNRIEGCFLVSEFDNVRGSDGNPESGIYVEYASTRNLRDVLALIEMMRFSMDRIWGKHAPDEHGYILNMDRTAEQIFQKLFPNGKLSGRVEEFTMLFESNSEV